MSVPGTRLPIADVLASVAIGVKRKTWLALSLTRFDPKPTLRGALIPQKYSC
jgi:hypothetical protein